MMSRKRKIRALMLEPVPVPLGALLVPAKKMAVHPINEKRKQLGAFATLIPELEHDPKK